MIRCFASFNPFGGYRGAAPSDPPEPGDRWGPISRALVVRYEELEKEGPECLLRVQVGALITVLNDHARAVWAITGLELARAATNGRLAEVRCRAGSVEGLEIQVPSRSLSFGDSRADREAGSGATRAEGDVYIACFQWLV